MVGQRDVVRLEHAVEMFRNPKDGQLAVTPSATHMCPIEKPHLVTATILDFLSGRGKEFKTPEGFFDS